MAARQTITEREDCRVAIHARAQQEALSAER